jgi:pilus assembly protein Flp/PilA
MLKSYFFLQSYLTGLLNRDDRGATAVEYGLIVFLIAVFIIGAVTAVGGQLNNVFNAVAGALGGA